MPAALRSIVGQRELTTALKTGDRASAVPLALELGAIAHKLLRELHMSTDKNSRLLDQARAKLQLDWARSEMQDEVFRAHQARIAALQDAKQERDADRRALQWEIDALKHALDAALKSHNPLRHTPPEMPQTSPTGTSSSSLTELVESFLSGYARDRKAAMFKKHQAALGLLDELHGNKRIDRLKQTDIVDYFTVVQSLPPRWSAQCKKRGISARQLASETHDVELGKKTFEDRPIGSASLCGVQQYRYPAPADQARHLDRRPWPCHGTTSTWRMSDFHSQRAGHHFRPPADQLTYTSPNSTP